MLQKTAGESILEEKKRVEERASAWGAGWGGVEREREREKERTHAGEKERALWLLFLYVFFFPLGLLHAKWAQSGVLFYLKSSLWSSDLPMTFLCSIFEGFSLPCLLPTAILDSCFLF